MLGFLIYLPTTYGIPHSVFFVAVLYVLAFKRDFRLKVNTNLFILLSIILASLVIRFFNIDEINARDFDVLPWFIGGLATYILALNLNEKEIKILIYFIALECVTVIAQSLMGVKSFWGGYGFQYINTGLLYYSAPSGLSSNSSVIAVKIMAALMLKDKISLNKYINAVVLILCVVGLFLTFNRSAIAAMMVFYFIGFAKYFNKINPAQKIIFAVGFVTFSFIGYFYFDFLMYQISRGQSSIGLSGRDDIWLSSLKFIKSNIWFGNGTFKYYSFAYAGMKEHLHNSFLEIIATSGIFILSGYLVLIFKNIKKTNISSIIVLSLYSLTQYGIFWGVSLLDIVLFYLLFVNCKNNPLKKYG